MSKEVAQTGGKQNTLSGLLETYKVEIARALPRHVKPDRMIKIALTSARKNPELLECTPESFLGAVIQSSQLGLEPDTPMGHAYLVPFRNGKTGKKEVNFMTGYRGLLDLVYRTADAPILWPTAVYDGDGFEYKLGLNPALDHVAMPHDSLARLTYVYCVASFRDGRKVFDVMTFAEVEAIRCRSKATGFTPWKTDYEAMAKKTVIRRMVKYLPMSAELQRAVGLDELAERGEDQGNEDFLREGKPIHTKAERVNARMEDMDNDPASFGNFK